MSTISGSYYNVSTANKTEKSKKNDKTEKSKENDKTDKNSKTDKKGKTKTGGVEGSFSEVNSANSASSASSASSVGSTGSTGSTGSVDAKRDYIRDQFSVYYEQEDSYSRLASAYQKLMEHALKDGDTEQYNSYKSALDDVEKKWDEHRGTISIYEVRRYEQEYGVHPYKEWSDSK